MLIEFVNDVVLTASDIVTDLLDEIDILTLKWVIEAVVAVAGNTTNAVSSILEQTVEVVSEQTENVDISPSLTEYSSALSDISATFTEVTGSVNDDCSGIISAADFQNTLGGVTDVVSSLARGLGLTDITAVVGGLADSLSGAVGGLLTGITGTLKNVVGGVVGGILSSLNGITGGKNAVVSQLTSSVSGVVNILSDVTLSITQVITVVVSIIGNLSTISNGLVKILETLGNIGNTGGSCFKILPC